MWEHFIDIEDLSLNSLHITLVFQAEDKGVACPPLSSERHLYPPLEGKIFYIYIYIYIYIYVCVCGLSVILSLSVQR